MACRILDIFFKSGDFLLDIDDCESNPCRNSGRCVDGPNRFDCICPKGFIGEDCSYRVDECASDPCPKGSKCIIGVDGFQCKCPKGKRGKRCQGLYRFSTFQDSRQGSVILLHAAQNLLKIFCIFDHFIFGCR